MFTLLRRARTIFLASAITVLIGGCQTLSQQAGLYPAIGQEDDWDWIHQKRHR